MRPGRPGHASGFGTVLLARNTGPAARLRAGERKPPWHLCRAGTAWASPGCWPARGRPDADGPTDFRTNKQTFLSTDSGYGGTRKVRPMVCREPVRTGVAPNGTAWEPETPQTEQGLSPTQRKRVKASIRRHMATLKKLS